MFDTPARAIKRVDTESRVESQAVRFALCFGVLGAIAGLIIGLVHGTRLALAGEWSFSVFAAIACTTAAAIASTTAYLRVRGDNASHWYRGLAPWRYYINAVSVALAHTALTAMVTTGAGLVLAQGFIGFKVAPVWCSALLGVATAASSFVVYVSAARVTTERMSALLVSYIGFGTLTAMLTTPVDAWWQEHFSRLGSTFTISGWIFNGTLIGGGLIVLTFAVYIGNDIDRLHGHGVVRSRLASPIVSTAFALMGASLAWVGAIPFDFDPRLHNVGAAGLSILFLFLLTVGQFLMRGMPRAFFEVTWVVLGVLLVGIGLFVSRTIVLTAFELIVFGLVFLWIDVCNRFLSRAAAAADPDEDAGDEL